METQKKLRIKKFFFGATAFIILLNLVFTQKNKEKKDTNTYSATFNKIDGVGVGTNVEISGIKVGQVEKILIKENYPTILLSVRKNINILELFLYCSSSLKQ